MASAELLSHMREYIHDEKHFTARWLKKGKVHLGLDTDVEVVALFLGGVLALVLFCGDQVQFLANFICILVPAMVTYVYPKERPPINLLLVYWTTYSTVSLLDNVFCIILPGYYGLKLCVMATMFLKPVNGAQWISTFLKENEFHLVLDSEAESDIGGFRFNEDELTAFKKARKKKSPPPEKPEDERVNSQIKSQTSFVSTQSKDKPEYKLKVVSFADEYGTLAAAAEFGVDDRSIRRWKVNRDVLKAANRSRRAFRGHKPRWEELESELREWVVSERVAKNQVSTIRIRLHAKAIAERLKIEDFAGGAHWCHSFMRRWNLAVRRTTSVGQKLPEDFKEKVARFRQFVYIESREISLANLGNMDEVPVSFDLPRSFTVDEKGKEDIGVMTTGSEKCNFTVVLAVTANGNKCPPLVIFKRKTVPKEKFPVGIIVKANENGWMNESMMEYWVKECWIERPNPSPDPQKSLLILDSARSHLTVTAKSSIQEHSKIAVIPGGLTKLLQPLDISVNKVFKNQLRSHWENWMSNADDHKYTKSGRMKRASYSEVCRWIIESFEAVSVDSIKNGFRRALEENIETLYEDLSALELDD